MLFRSAIIGLDSIPTVCASYSLAGVGNLSSATTYSHINLAGSAMGLGSELDIAKLTTEYLKFTGDINKPVMVYESRMLAPDEASITVLGDNKTITLRKANTMPRGHKIYLYNHSGTNLTVTGSSESIVRLNGSSGSVTIAPYSGAEFFVRYSGMSNQWLQIR